MGRNETSRQVLLDETATPYGLRLELAPDAMACYATRPTAEGTTPLALDQLQQILTEQAITHGLIPEALAAFCTGTEGTQAVPETLLAEGTPPERGEDGRLELKPRASEEAHYQEDATGHADMRAVMVFDNVEPEQEIGHVFPPTTGADGVTVTGRPVPGITGQPLACKLGPGVHLQHETGAVLAAISGRIVHNDKALDVTADYLVQGDVDMSVGHIQFNGFVKVTGDVLDGFNIRGTKGIEVGGTVGRCQLDSDGAVTLGGMAGKGAGRVRCGGDLTARMLNDVLVECGGNVTVHNEIRNSHVKALGQVLVSNGMILGGTVMACAGVETMKIGAPNGSRTHVIAGVDYVAYDRKVWLRQRLQETDHEIHLIVHLVGTIRQRLGDEHALPPNVQKLLERLEGLENTRVVMAHEFEVCDPLAAEQALPQINVRGTLHEGTVLTLGDRRHTFDLDQPGPTTIRPDREGDGLRFLSLAPFAPPTEDEQEIPVAG